MLVLRVIWVYSLACAAGPRALRLCSPDPPNSPPTHPHHPPTRPGYIIRSIPTTTTDRVLCKVLAHNAVHAAFAGFTGVSAGLVNTHYVYMPASVVTTAARRVDPRGKQWNRLRATIGQPNFA